MERKAIGLLAFVIFFLIVDCYGAESGVNTTDPINGIDPKSSLPSKGKNGSIMKTSVLDSGKVDLEKKGEDQDVEFQGEIKNDPKNSFASKQSNLKEDLKTRTDKDDSSKESEMGGHEKEKLSEVLETTVGVSKEGIKDGVLVTLEHLMKESSWDEECDPSIQCKDEKTNLIACLSVPQNAPSVSLGCIENFGYNDGLWLPESSGLSLLMRNEGKGPLSVNISAPYFVHVENTTVQLHEKEDIKVNVSVGSEYNDTSIVLTAKNGSCILDLRDLVLNGTTNKIDHSPKTTHTNLPSIIYMLAAVLLLMASAWMCVRLRRSHFFINNFRYQKPEMKLPVSGGGKTESDVTGWWDNSWGDSWDDVEAPKTPSKPVTPSKGLVSRRSSKKGWKD